MEIKVVLEIGKEDGTFGKKKREFIFDKTILKRRIDYFDYNNVRNQYSRFIGSLYESFWYIPYRGSLVTNEENTLYATFNNDIKKEIDPINPEGSIHNVLFFMFRKMEREGLPQAPDSSAILRDSVPEAATVNIL